MEYTITINGREYPARFTLRVAMDAADRRGGSLGKLLRNDNQAEFLGDVCWLAVEMIKAGAAIREKKTGRQTAEIPTVDELLDSVDFADVMELQSQLLTVINKDEPTVKAEGPGKNTDATPAS